MIPLSIRNFDTEHQTALRGLWFLEDVHGEFEWISKALMDAKELQSHIIFLGDVDFAHRPLREILQPLRKSYPSVQVALIHGNHDADSYDAWECLHDAGDDAIKLHGNVAILDGIRVAGLGGVFMGKVWKPPEVPKLNSKEAAIYRGAFQFRGGQRPSPTYLVAVYPDDYDRLRELSADILVTDEAPACHPYGWEALDVLATVMKVKRTFHGDHHDDQTERYRLTIFNRDFDAVAVPFCGVKKLDWGDCFRVTLRIEIR